MHHFLIDTDTAADDAVALLMALREPAVKVEAITIVAGNCPIHTATKNALNVIERAGTYQPPVYLGAHKPMMRELETCEGIHGEDGMGNMFLPEPRIAAQNGHAVDKIIELAHQFKGELQIITIGPLTNLAMAFLKEPELPKLIKNLYIMGGTGLGGGNVTPVAEFNIWADAEAAHIVLSGLFEPTFIGWDVITGDTFLNSTDIQDVKQAGVVGEFSVRCLQKLIEFNNTIGNDGVDLADPTAMAVALYPEIVTKGLHVYGVVEYKSEHSYGQLIIDQYGLMKKDANMTVVTGIDGEAFKKKLIHLMS